MRTITTTRRHVLLHCCAGTSDKTYEMKLTHNASKTDIKLDIYYGKKHGTKVHDTRYFGYITEADKWFMDQLRSKLKKGYVDISSPDMGITSNAKSTGRKKKEITPEMVNKAESLLAFAEAL